jgi:hypothetical protein
VVKSVNYKSKTIGSYQTKEEALRDEFDIPDSNNIPNVDIPNFNTTPKKDNKLANFLNNLFSGNNPTIIKYIQELRPNAKEDDYLFIRVQNVKNNTKLTQPAIYKMVIESAKKAGIEKKVSTHSCRATLATLLHNQGTPIGQIQTLLNHKDITTTSIYIKKANEIEESAAMKLNLSHFPDQNK